MPAATEMDAPADAGLRHSIDRLILGDRRVFGWGWAAGSNAAVKSIELRVEGEGWSVRLPASRGLARKDVEDAYPDLVEAGRSGFVLTGFLPHPAPSRAVLEIGLDSGIVEVDVTQGAEKLHSKRTRGRRLAWMVKSVWRRLKRGDFAGIVRRARAQSYSAPSVADLDLVSHLADELRRFKAVTVVFDHGMGGGSNQYRRREIAQRQARGEAVLLCTYNLPTLGYQLEWMPPQGEARTYRISSFLALDAVVEVPAVRELFVNSPVSFDEPLVLAEWLARTRERLPHVRLTVTTHDFFAVCPSFVLLDRDGRYCGIPEISTCVECLSKHRASWVALSPPSEIGAWRALWGRCLRAADEVRCFSGSSRELILRAYPALDPAHVTVIPHRIEFVPSRLPRVSARAPLTIGIVGEISEQKGANVVRDLVRLVETASPDARVVIIGTVNVAIKSARLVVTGAYDRADLPELIERHGINVCFFPSIWPETFSYVVAELEALEMPIVAFDMGAPAERLRAYGKSRLCTEVSAAAAFAALNDLHRTLALAEPAAA
jgi:glycosyltransferase involved in cell wall biosynthesis